MNFLYRDNALENSIHLNFYVIDRGLPVQIWIQLTLALNQSASQYCCSRNICKRKIRPKVDVFQIQLQLFFQQTVHLS